MYQVYPQEKKIFAPLAFAFIFLIVFMLSITFERKKSRLTMAARNKLERMVIANVTNNSATIFWRTSEKTSSFVIYGEEKNQINKQALDERDVGNKRNSYFNHYVVLKNLLPNKQYFFRIVIPKGVVQKENNLPFSFFTKSQPPQATRLAPIIGKVQNKNGTPLRQGAVFFKTEESDLLFDITKEKGEWLIPLYYLTKANTNEFLRPTPETLATIEIISEEGEKSMIKTILKKASPLPQTIIIGENYEFGDDNDQKVLSKTIKRGQNFGKIDIISPQEGAVIDGRKPAFRGVALPRQKVKIIIESTPQIVEIYTDQDGIWKLTPFYELEPGSHRVTLIAKDENGREVKIVRNFTILKSGERVLGEATPSATLTPTTIPTEIPTATPTLPPFPTETISPTEPRSGINFFPLAIFGVSLTLLGLGLVIIF